MARMWGSPECAVTSRGNLIASMLGLHSGPRDPREERQGGQMGGADQMRGG